MRYLLEVRGRHNPRISGEIEFLESGKRESYPFTDIGFPQTLGGEIPNGQYVVLLNTEEKNDGVELVSSGEWIYNTKNRPDHVRMVDKMWFEVRDGWIIAISSGQITVDPWAVWPSYFQSFKAALNFCKRVEPDWSREQCKTEVKTRITNQTITIERG